MKSLKNAILLMVLLTGVSCNKVLDVAPDKYIIGNEQFYSTEKEINTALNGVYATLAEGNLYGNHLQGRMGLEADEGFARYALDANTIAYYDVSSADTKVLGYWTTLYKGINRANAVLENLDRPPLDDAKRKNIRGQALFLRGYFYFMLVNKFGGVPLILEQTKSGKSEDVQIPRALARDVYDQVIKDMTEAAELVPEIDAVESAGRVSKSAVWGILARVCLYMAGEPVKDAGKYAEAKGWAEKVIQSGKHDLNPSYEQVFINYAQDRYDIKESIWEVEFYGNGFDIYTSAGGFVGRNTGIENTVDYQIGYCVGIIHPTIWLHSAYSANDLRREWNIPSWKYDGNPAVKVPVTGSVVYRFCGKFRREYETLLPKGGAQTPQNAPLLRYSDVLLMYAEASNEAEKYASPAAHEAINQVIRRGFGLDPKTVNPSVDLSGLSYDEFREEIMDERGRELCFEGLRKNDIVRWGLFYANMKTVLQNVPQGTTLVLRAAQEIYSNVSQRDVLWPIPSYEMGVNKKLVQNPGW